MRCFLGVATDALLFAAGVARAQSAPHAGLSSGLDTVLYGAVVPRSSRVTGSTPSFISTAIATAGIARRTIEPVDMMMRDTLQKRQAGHRVKHAAIGAVIGTAAGLLVGATIGANLDRTVSITPYPGAVVGAVEGAGIGLVLGLVAGALVR